MKFFADNFLYFYLKKSLFYLFSTLSKRGETASRTLPFKGSNFSFLNYLDDSIDAFLFKKY